MKKIISAVVSAAVLTGSSLILTASAHAESKVVCKKRSPQVYSAFYRTEVITNEDGQTRFEYGIGDSSQIYELYYFSPVNRTAENIYETAPGVNPHLRVEIQQKRKYRELQFSLVDTHGTVTKRDGYRCNY